MQAYVQNGSLEIRAENGSYLDGYRGMDRHWLIRHGRNRAFREVEDGSDEESHHCCGLLSTISHEKSIIEAYNTHADTIEPLETFSLLSLFSFPAVLRFDHPSAFLLATEATLGLMGTSNEFFIGTNGEISAEVALVKFGFEVRSCNVISWTTLLRLTYSGITGDECCSKGEDFIPGEVAN